MGECVWNCRYLRLSKANIGELEDQVWEKGIDPGMHAHVTEQQVEEYFDKMPMPKVTQPKPKKITHVHRYKVKTPPRPE